MRTVPRCHLERSVERRQTAASLHERTARGFAILELVLVVAIIATLAAIVVPRYSTATARYRADLTARRIAADLNFARDHARTTSQSVTVTFDLTGNVVSVPGVSGMKGTSSAYIVDLDEEPYRADLTAVDFGGNQGVVFDMYGRPDSAGQIALQVGSTQKTITVNADTGKASVQ